MSFLSCLALHYEEKIEVFEIEVFGIKVFEIKVFQIKVLEIKVFNFKVLSNTCGYFVKHTQSPLLHL